MTSGAKTDARGALQAAAKERILLTDGGWGTQIQLRKLTEACYAGNLGLSHDQKGNNDILALTRPDIVAAIGEAYLAAGVVDEFRARGLRIFGPTKAAAQLESSKAFAKDFMARHNIPTAKYATFSNYDDSVRYLESLDYPVVIKASGLAAGKGVILPETNEEAISTLEDILVKKVFGEAGAEVPMRIVRDGRESWLRVKSADRTSFLKRPSLQ